MMTQFDGCISWLKYLLFAASHASNFVWLLSTKLYFHLWGNVGTSWVVSAVYKAHITIYSGIRKLRLAGAGMK